MDAPNEEQFKTAYLTLNDELGAVYDELRRMEKNTYRNSAKLNDVEAKVEKLSREVDRLREKFHKEYEIYDVIAATESTYKFLLNDITALYLKPIQTSPANRIANWTLKARRRSLTNRLKTLNPFTKRRTQSFGGTRHMKRRKH